jgi:anti-sigma regulatory factor (Ser/Thr protein kinase)
MSAPPTDRTLYDPRPEHVRDARDHVADLLRDEGWSDVAIEKARLVISELATNAILHAQTRFELSCQIAQTARFEVRDFDPHSMPMVLELQPERAGGLGLRLIEAISTAWGVESNSDSKVVWCTLDASGWPHRSADPSSATASLAHR